MSEKEKGKEIRKDTSTSDTPDNPSRQETPGSTSMASRIQDSASGLIRNAISAPGAHGLSADLAQSLANGSKAGSSISHGLSAGIPGPSSTAESFRSRGVGPSGSATARDGIESSVPESFRSGVTTQGGFELDPLAQDEFQRGFDNEFLYNRTEVSDLKGKGKDRERGTNSEDDFASFHTAWDGVHYHSQGAPTQIPHAVQPAMQASDGSAVVSLLTDPSFQPEFLPTEDDPLDSTDMDLVPPLTASELQIIESFRRHPSMASATPQNQPHRITSTSLVPDIDTFLSQGSPAADTTSLRDSVLSDLPGAEDWLAVEDRYHDEVWGYLRPALEAAQKEIEEKKEGVGHEEDGPAVRRLRMILRHMHS